MTDTPEAPSADDAVVQEGSEGGDTTQESTEEANEGSQEQAVEKAEEDYWREFLAERPLKVKIHGKETLLNSYEEVKKYASLGNRAYDQIGEAKKAKEEAEKLQESLSKAGLKDILKMRGLEGDSAINEIAALIQELNEEAEMDPREKKLRELEAREKEREEAASKEQEEAQQAAYLKEVEKIQEELIGEIHEAVQSIGLPETGFLMNQVFSELEQAVSAGVDLSPKEAVAVVQKQFFKDYTRYVRDLDASAIEKILGEDQIKALRKKWVSDAKQAEAPLANSRKKSAGQVQPRAEEEPDIFGRRTSKAEKSSVSTQEFFRKLERGEID